MVYSIVSEYSLTGMEGRGYFMGEIKKRKLTKPTFDKLSEEKKLMILRTAISEFASQGFDHTNINIIAEKAGISVGSLYKYFGSKQDLFLVTIHQGTEVLKTILQAIVPSDQSFEEKCRELVKAIQKSSREQLELIRLYSELTSVGNSELVRQLSYEIESISAEMYTELVKEGQRTGEIRRDIDPAMAAFLMDNLFISLQFSYSNEYYQQRFKIFLGNDIENRDTFVLDQMVSFISHALKI
ncbi:TetR/AcrR family transcriptional regulator [uncultured Sphaerochaeta sp.]|uniref:TetR/AcrR family transcriptional regulator n=1 Tax=uncultured Sphaerochaeta sp. TaxID=886478 RepID=UPI002A0A53A2|nr:TetR/AcrR family transcriptional regulator [uncultured Sphaerochaeta sp.]